MSVGSSLGCASTLPEIMQENRLQQLNTPSDNNIVTATVAQSSRLDVEPASVDTNKIESPSSTNPISSVNAVSASEPISNSIIEETLANNKSTANSYR